MASCDGLPATIEQPDLHLLHEVLCNLLDLKMNDVMRLDLEITYSRVKGRAILLKRLGGRAYLENDDVAKEEKAIDFGIKYAP